MRFDYWDVNRFADELVGIATSESLRDELAKNVSNEYSRISWRDVAKSIQEIYRTEGMLA